ncbi:hypothetical protein [Christiangramia crocea]|uniref:Uncharacterized protein n=1 Tax=Christiangramia crocea TaxID=2904124 RepID=A0A9X1UX81_9FLAO|nr:hypothetical protein [Gramella crocea]MCG9970993.1 hypothetical protein [Gramella crocea]
MPRSFWLSKRGFDYNTIADLTAEGIAAEIQKGNIIPMPLGFSFERLTEENVVETSPLGLSSLSRKGIYKYRFSWDKDDRLQEVMSSYDSNDVYDFVMLDAKGNMKLTKNGTKITGASVGLLDTDPFTESDGSVAGKVRMMVELNNPQDYNKFAAYFAADNLPFRPLKVEGINDVDLDLTSFAAAATEITFTAMLKDGSTAFSGGVADDFRLIVNGTAVPIDGTTVTIAEDSSIPGKYTISGIPALASSDEIKLSTWDATASTVSIIKDGTTVYRGAQVTEVVS